mgnify:FL=1
MSNTDDSEYGPAIAPRRAPPQKQVLSREHDADDFYTAADGALGLDDHIAAHVVRVAAKTEALGLRLQHRNLEGPYSIVTPIGEVATLDTLDGLSSWLDAWAAARFPD